MFAKKLFSASSFYSLFALLSTIFQISSGLQNCAVWSQIQPCTCKTENTLTTVTCERMKSFGEIAAILHNKFYEKDRMALHINDSYLYDLHERSFQELNLTIEKLTLNFVHLNFHDLEALSFSGLANVVFLSLADNQIPISPEHLFTMMPRVKTLDLGRSHVQYLTETSFQSFSNLETLLLADNYFSYIDRKSIPPTVQQLHIGRNNLRDLNGTLRELTNLKWIFINTNELTTLDDQLPKYAEKFHMIHTAHNKIERLPVEFKNYPQLESLFFQNNLVQRFDGVLSKSKKLTRVQFEHNRLNRLSPDDFAETENLEFLILGHNHLTSFNGSLQPLKKLAHINVTHNSFTEFSLQEITGLMALNEVDLSHNRLTKLIGLPPNLVEWETGIRNLYLQYNALSSLNASLSGLRNLQKLNISHNRITRILPDDLIGLDHLMMLDISFNHLTTLEETSRTFLPALEELIAHHNNLKYLDRDFHGLPVLCWADLSNNQIERISKDLVSKTHCKLHSIHEEWGILNITLTDNPAVCLNNLPEIRAEFEVNHAKIIGECKQWPSIHNSYYSPGSHLDPVPTYIQSHINRPSNTVHNPSHHHHNVHNLPHHHTGHNPLHHHNVLNPTQHTVHNPPHETPERPYIHNNIPINNVNNLNGQLIYENNGVEGKIPDQYLYNLNRPGENGNTKSNVLSPVPSQNLLSDRLSIPLGPPILQEQPIRYRSLAPGENQQAEEINPQEQTLQEGPRYATIDPILQQTQFNEFATKFKELETKVDELVNQNKQLVENLNHILPHQVQIQSNITTETKPPLPVILEQIVNATEKPIIIELLSNISTTEKPVVIEESIPVDETKTNNSEDLPSAQ